MQIIHMNLHKKNQLDLKKNEGVTAVFVILHFLKKALYNKFLFVCLSPRI